MGVWVKNNLLPEPPQEFIKLRKPISIEFFGPDNNIWVFMNTFNKPKSEFQNTARELQNLKNGNNIIVLDFRYNRGGSSSGGIEILSALYGKDYPEQTADKIQAEAQTYFRVTEWSLNYYKKITKEYGMEEEYVKKDLAGMGEALKAGENLYIRKDDENIIAAPTSLNNRVFALTDGYCASACLYIMDVIKANGDIVHIGLPTGGDTIYVQSGIEDLPSGLGQFMVAYQGYLKPLRKNHEKYNPDFKFKGNINDTKAIQNWVIELNKKIQNK